MSVSEKNLISTFLTIFFSLSHGKDLPYYKSFCKWMALDTTFEFLGVVHGFHVYRKIWRPFKEGMGISLTCLPLKFVDPPIMTR